MNDTPHSKIDASAEPDHVHKDVESILDQVESMANEVLAGTEPTVATPVQAPDVVADDIGLSQTSPLIQDGQKTPANEVVADVDRELDYMERLIRNMGPAEEKKSPAKSSFGSAHSSTESETNEATDVADVADEIADQIAPEPAMIAFSPEEKKLDDELDQLINSPASTSPAAQVRSASPPAPVAPAPKPAVETVSSHEQISVRRVIRIRTTQLIIRTGDKLVDGLLWILNMIDKPFTRFSPRMRELIGYCALATLAMSFIALLITLFR